MCLHCLVSFAEFLSGLPLACSQLQSWRPKPEQHRPTLNEKANRGDRLGETPGYPPGTSGRSPWQFRETLEVKPNWLVERGWEDFLRCWKDRWSKRLPSAMQKSESTRG